MFPSRQVNILLRGGFPILPTPFIGGFSTVRHSALLGTSEVTLTAIVKTGDEICSVIRFFAEHGADPDLLDENGVDSYFRS